MKIERLFIYGSGGHAKVIADMAESLEMPLVAALDQHGTGKVLLDKYPVYTTVEKEDHDYFIIAVGNNQVRKRISEQELKDCNFAIIKDKSAVISKYAVIKTGTVIMPGATVNVDAEIGQHCIINTNASIDHDCKIDDYVHISPNASLAGNVLVGTGSHIGIGATIIQGVKIGEWCTVGAGAVIIKDVPDGVTVVGNPGRLIKGKDE